MLEANSTEAFLDRLRLTCKMSDRITCSSSSLAQTIGFGGSTLLVNIVALWLARVFWGRVTSLVAPSTICPREPDEPGKAMTILPETFSSAMRCSSCILLLSTCVYSEETFALVSSARARTRARAVIGSEETDYRS